MKENEKNYKNIIMGVVIVVLLIAVVVCGININSKNKENVKLQQEINEIKNAIELPLDSILNENPDSTQNP